MSDNKEEIRHIRIPLVDGRFIDGIEFDFKDCDEVYHYKIARTDHDAFDTAPLVKPDDWQVIEAWDQVIISQDHNDPKRFKIAVDKTKSRARVEHEDEEKLDIIIEPK